jgi:hypothetical protein
MITESEASTFHDSSESICAQLAPGLLFCYVTLTFAPFKDFIEECVEYGDSFFSMNSFTLMVLLEYN